MQLKQSDLETLLQTAIQAAEDAGAFIAAHADDDVGVDIKAEGLSRAAQVVTHVDRASQDIILKHITPTLQKFDLGLLCEESHDDGSRFNKDYFWCIDPLDGTLPFVEKRPGYCVSIALVAHTGVPMIGIVYDPLMSTLYHASHNQGAFLNHHPWALKTPTDDTPRHIDRGGAVMNACWVLQEPPAYYHKQPKSADGGGCLWDYAATACIFTELGAWVSDSYGKPLELNRRDSVFMNHKGIFFTNDKRFFKMKK